MVMRKWTNFYRLATLFVTLSVICLNVILLRMLQSVSFQHIGDPFQSKKPGVFWPTDYHHIQPLHLYSMPSIRQTQRKRVNKSNDISENSLAGNGFGLHYDKNAMWRKPVSVNTKSHNDSQSLSTYTRQTLRSNQMEQNNIHLTDTSSIDIDVRRNQQWSSLRDSSKRITLLKSNDFTNDYIDEFIQMMIKSNILDIPDGQDISEEDYFLFLRRQRLKRPIGMRLPFYKQYHSYVPIFFLHTFLLRMFMHLNLCVHKREGVCCL